jgi:hypothetical protein
MQLAADLMVGNRDRSQSESLITGRVG